MQKKSRRRSPCAKSGAKRSADALKKQHEKELKREKSALFKENRAKNKTITTLESAVAQAKADNEKIKNDCDERVASME